MKTALALLALVAALPAAALPPCSADSRPGERCEVALAALRPTQPVVGLLQVEDKAAELAAKSPAKLERYLEKRPIPLVIGPDGGFYLTDHHHLARALLLLGRKQAGAKVVDRLGDPAQFWNTMAARHWAWLRDPHGRPIEPRQLPARVADMADDPYRALAGLAEDRGAYRDTDAWFQEFHWARYFGERMGWRPIERANLDAALREAVRLACEPAAAGLPGYAGPCRD
ncbi:ParB-like protein [Chitinimonas koreensis]|uniref:ParB-like protein n=1 Tax=Chitinimonas koreensis TaxID=356302 RepID=UPI00040528D3|nr:ParB-like protein [Chitinimonas koreensis]QNM97390.1 chromosome partitioning protein ParB [Chitinimonas koreensis]